MGPNDELRRIATGLVENCRNGADEANLDAFYAEDAVSVEALAPPGESRISNGLAAIREKHAWWRETMEELPTDLAREQMAEGPFYHGEDRFSVVFRAKARNRQTGEILDMLEVAVYTVQDGRISREEFFYSA